jgi:shikimate kinase
MAIFRTSQPGSAADPSHPHLILVGLPGSGKSTVAAILARRLGRTFLDFDAEITRREGLTIAEIFAQRGEPVFRQLEHALTEEVALCGGMVLAPGGGWVSQPDTVALLRPTARMVYLAISPAGAIRRMGRNVVGRPLLSRPDPRSELERLLMTRRSVYESADLVVNVEHLDPQRVADHVQRRLSL